MVSLTNRFRTVSVNTASFDDSRGVPAPDAYLHRSGFWLHIDDELPRYAKDMGVRREISRSHQSIDAPSNSDRKCRRGEMSSNLAFNNHRSATRRSIVPVGDRTAVAQRRKVRSCRPNIASVAPVRGSGSLVGR